MRRDKWPQKKGENGHHVVDLYEKSGETSQSYQISWLYCHGFTTRIPNRMATLGVSPVFIHTQVNSAKQLKQLKTLLRLRRFPLETGSCCDRTIPPCLSATVATVSEFISMLWSADVGSVTSGISEKPLEACTLCTPSRPGQVGCTG